MAEALNDKQTRFVEAYVGEAHLNAAKAARLAGYPEGTSRIIGYENLSKPYIRAAIDRRLAARSLSAAEVLERFAQIARNDASEYVHEDGYIDLKRMKAEGKIHLVKGIKDTKDGKVIELMDPQAALGTLAKHHGLLRDQIEITTLGKVSKALDEMDNAELLAFAERIAGIASRTGDTEAPTAGEAEGEGAGAA